MIYFDNSATTLQKPPEVALCVKGAIDSLGNSGRSFYTPAVEASRLIYNARSEIAKLVNLNDPLNVAFTSGATESLNLVFNSLIRKTDSVITTVLEHNSVLRPLYNIGCSIKFIDCDDKGNLVLDNLESLVDNTIKFIVATHGSNVLGSVVPVYKLYEFAKSKGLIFILDASQTIGCAPVLADMADVICFTGHKALFGPQGTGGIITTLRDSFKLVKTGGSGANSFERYQDLTMPDIFEAGTANAHSLAGLNAGVKFINEIGTDKIEEHTKALTKRFISSISDIPNIKIYGESELPIVSLNITGMSSDDLSLKLWENYEIATRPGAHCAPLIHERFGTVENGMVRFSFSYLNTANEINKAVEAIKNIAKNN